MPAALELSFDPHTIQHLGSNMYSRLPNAVAELVANSYDADATTITVAIEGKHPEQAIVVSDDGHGMSRDDVQQKYLRIGRNRRGDASTNSLSESGKRKVSGKKGLGKLALFGIGDVVEIRTTRAGSKRWNSAALRWQDILEAEGTYSPVEDSGPSPTGEHETTVRISSLSRKTPIDPESLASSLSSLFCYADSTLTVTVVGPDGARYPVNTEARLNDLVTEFRWPVPEGLPVVDKDRATLARWGVSGLIVASAKPLKAHVRGVSVYVNGRLANEPEFFDAAASSLAYTYLTGYVNVDKLDTIKPDVIATDRRAINWENPDVEELAEALREVVRAVAQDRRRRREEKREEAAEQVSGAKVSEWVDSIKGHQGAAVGDILSIIHSDEVDLPPQTAERMISDIHSIAPPDADMVWRNLHPRIQEAIESYYKNLDYLTAVKEGYNALVQFVRERSGASDIDESKLFKAVFLLDDANHIDLLHPFDTSKMAQQSVRSFAAGHADLAIGISSAFRNPASHHTNKLLSDIGLYEWKDCLDALTAISYICWRVERATGDHESTRP